MSSGIFPDITAPVWRVTRAQHPEVIWARYADALGLEELKATFGDHWPPKAARFGEEVYVWRNANLNPGPFDPKDHPAAWVSLFRDSLEPGDVYMSRGVWPTEHGQGLGRLMRDYAEQWCRERGATLLNIFVSASNWRHMTQVVKDKYWVMDSLIFGDDPQFGFHHKIFNLDDEVKKNQDDHAAAERLILAWKRGDLGDGDVKMLLDQISSGERPPNKFTQVK